jgi:spermidine synthase
MSAGDASSGPLRDIIRRYYGGSCKIVTVRRSAGGNAFLFVVDAVQRARFLRILGTVGRAGAVLEHSAMDLLHPERLVFGYERLMLVALAVVAEPAKLLLLGLGGGAMSRHLQAYVPYAALTVVERDPVVIGLAREHFHIRRAVLRADAADAVADARAGYDAVLVDLYDAGGVAPLEDGFWRDCVRALRPGGCLAVNWAGSWSDGPAQQVIARVMPDMGRSLFLAERGVRPNVVQLVPTAPGLRADRVAARFRDFAQNHDLPREDRDALARCGISARYPGSVRRGRI